MAEDITLTRKRIATHDQPKWNKCLCHVKSNVKEKLTQFTKKSWVKFEKCSSSRKDAIWLSMKDHWQSGPRGGYHRQCYQEYTNIDKISRSKIADKRVSNTVSSTDDEVNDEPPTKRLCRSQLESFNIQKCIICQKDKVKRTKGSARTREPLTQNISEYGSDSLLKAATIRGDKRILMQIEGQDTIALEVKYHRSCYKEYVRQENLARLEENNCEMEDSSTESYQIAFREVREYAQVEIITNAKVVKMTDLINKFVCVLVEKGIETTGYRSSKLKLRLKKYFGEQLSFHQPVNPNQPELVYCSKVSKGAIIETVVNNAMCSIENDDLAETATDTLDDKETTKDTQEQDGRQVYHTAKLLRRILLDVKPKLSWPLCMNDLDCDNDIVPDILYNMLAWLLSPKAEYCSTRVSNIPSHVHRLVLSLAQDMIHSVSRGRIKTPKHIALPIAVKSLTGNCEVITMLNRFGHGLSYSQIEEVETALAEKEIDKQRDGAMLPSVCSPGVPAVFCWDNNDLLEETLSGKGTTHCTNGIVIQRKPHTCELPPVIPSVQSGKRPKRSITGISSDILPYHSGPRIGPSPANIDLSIVIERRPQVISSAKLTDFGWMVCRQSFEDTLFELKEQQQVIPAWTGFNMTLQERTVPRESSIGYCPVIEASPTELPTVYTLLQRSLQMADQLNQHDVIVVFDQAIYAKALEVVWQNQEMFQRMVLRMGSFHTICAFLAAIGKRFGDAGLADILVESGIIGAGSVAGVLEGKHYNRAVRMHKIVFEALHRLQWQGFKQWLQAHDKPINYAVLISAIKEIRREFAADKFDKLMLEPQFQELSNLYDDFCQDNNGPMKTFWNSYLHMVTTVMHFIRATREGDWSLHLNCVKEFLPWFFAYDHINYSRYLPVYLVHMLSLQETHFEAHQQLVGGDFGVQRSTVQGFTQVPVDQTIEQTLNRSTKSKGGIIGFSLKKGAVQRWILTAHSRAAIVDKCREMTSIGKRKGQTHKETGPSRMKKDEADVQKVMGTVLNWCNPFEASEDLTSISSGFVAGEAMKNDLLGAREKGNKALTSFVKDRIQSNKVGFFDKLSKLKLGTFRDAHKKSSVKTSGKEVIITADRNLFARLIVIGQSRHIDLRDLLTHELGIFPWSLAALDGSLAKTNKATLQKALENKVECLTALPPNTTAVIIDAMATLQMIVKVPDRFSDLSEMILTNILAQAGTAATRVDFVADQYPEISIKSTEREKRGRDGQMLFNISSRQQSCPRQWKRFMVNGLNKTRLMHFLVYDWSTNDDVFVEKIRSRTLYVTHGCDCTKIEVEDGKIATRTVLDLCSNQEEADTRMFLHAQHASLCGHQQVAIKSSDTDVEVLACYHQSSIAAELTLISGTRTRSRLVSIPKVCEKIGPEVCQILPAFHALTGCDSVSAFVGKGKTNPFKMVVKSEELRCMISGLGERIPPRNVDIKKTERFVCNLYHASDTEDVNEIRYKMFCKGKNVQSYQLPPTRASLLNHIKRANYQSYLWKNALESNNSSTSPDGQGWQVKGKCLEISWNQIAPAPEGVMQLISCGCKGDCETKRCSCLKNGLPCSEACQCSDECQNSTEQIDTDDSDSEEDELEFSDED